MSNDDSFAENVTAMTLEAFEKLRREGTLPLGGSRLRESVSFLQNASADAVESTNFKNSACGDVG